MKSRHMGFLGNLLLTLVALAFIYPLIWLMTASFKSNEEIFSSLDLLTANPTFEGYIKGWKGIGQITFSRFFNNSMILTVPTVLLTLVSSSLVAYGFDRFHFKGKRLIFGIMLSTMMLPNTIVMIPRYILFMRFGWLNSYRPFYALVLLTIRFNPQMTSRNNQ